MTQQIKNLNNCKDLNELKTLYKKLVFIYHPDKGGKTEDMQDLNNLYKKLFEVLKNSMNKEEESYKQVQYENSSDFMEFLNLVMKFDGLIIEIVGSWYWLENNEIAKNNYHELRSLGLLWGKTQQKLFWCKGMTEKSKVKYKKKSFEQIKDTYGYSKFNVKSIPQLT